MFALSFLSNTQLQDKDKKLEAAINILAEEQPKQEFAYEEEVIRVEQPKKKQKKLKPKKVSLLFLSLSLSLSPNPFSFPPNPSSPPLLLKIVAPEEMVLVRDEHKNSKSAQDILLENFDISYGGTSLMEGANLRCVFGRKYALVGRNGAGKSTLLRHIAAREVLFLLLFSPLYFSLFLFLFSYFFSFFFFFFFWGIVGRYP